MYGGGEEYMELQEETAHYRIIVEFPHLKGIDGDENRPLVELKW